MHARTFLPLPHSNTVGGAQPDRQEEFPVAAEVYTAHAHFMSSMEDGQRLLGDIVPHKDRSRLSNLSSGYH